MRQNVKNEVIVHEKVDLNIWTKDLENSMIHKFDLSSKHFMEDKSYFTLINDYFASSN